MAAARELQAKLCVEYPHGIPVGSRVVLKRLGPGSRMTSCTDWDLSPPLTLSCTGWGRDTRTAVCSFDPAMPTMCNNLHCPVQKLVLAQLRAEGMLTLADLPSLGFASSASNAAF